MAVLVAISATVGATTLSSAAPSREDVQRAKARLDALNQELSLLVEEFNQARLRLQAVQARLGDVREQANRRAGRRRGCRGAPERERRSRVPGRGSQVAVLFESTSLAEFSDRLEFIGSMAQADTDLALEAELARQDARWTAEELAATARSAKACSPTIDANAAQIEERVAERATSTRNSIASTRWRAARRRPPSSGGRSAQTSAAAPPGPIPPPPAPNGNVAAVSAAPTR